MQTIEFSWESDLGRTGSDDDPNNPISRAFNRMLLHGKPDDAFTFCFYGGEESELARIYPLRWFGVFVLTSVGKVLIFPGFDVIPIGISVNRGISQESRSLFVLDHLTLEMDRQRLHATTPESEDHINLGRTPNLGNDRLLWLGMSIAEDTLLRILSKDTYVIAPTPSSDSFRRFEILRVLGRDASHNIIHLIDGSRNLFEQGFLHFRFIVGPYNAPTYPGENLLHPIDSRFWSGPSSTELTNLPIRTHDVNLGESITIQVTTSWLPGSLSVPVVLTIELSL